MRPAGRIGLALAALTLLLVATVPDTVLADHTYAHRYYILGRVVDKDGYPVSNITVRVLLDSGTQSGRSGETEKAYRVYQTDCDGNYGWNVKNVPYQDTSDRSILHAYLHVHEPRTTGSLKIEAVDTPFPLQNATGYVYPQTENAVHSVFRSDLPVIGRATPPVDAVLRASVVNLKLDVAKPGNRCPGAMERFERSYTVAGRLMKEIPREERDGGGIVVSEPITNAPVTATLSYNDGKTANGTVRTNEVGDYVITLSLSEPLQSGRVTISGNGKTDTYDADTTFHTSTAKDLSEAQPWYKSKWFTFLAVAGGIALVVGGAAYFIGRSPKEPSGRKKNR